MKDTVKKEEKIAGKVLEIKQMKKQRNVNGKKEMEIQESMVPPKILVLAFEAAFLSDTQAFMGSKKGKCVRV